MPAHTDTFTVRTRGKGTTEITREIAAIVARSGIRQGTVTVFVCHTSASLVIMENADPSARRDLERFFEQLVPEDTPWFSHTQEGPDDMPSHIRMALTRTSEVIPVIHGRMTLGTWQGIFLFEHRRSPHHREIAVSVVGETSGAGAVSSEPS
jgi:secondary thiamine-phosphate synthase enzyme